MYTKGCYGSAVIFRLTSPECQACPDLESCAKLIKQREPIIKGKVRTLERLFSAPCKTDMEKWLASKWKRAAKKKDANATSRTLLETWTAQGVNVYLLKNGTNPASEKTDVATQSIFEQIAKDGPFKPRDITETLSDSHASMTKSARDKLVRDTVNALVLAGVIKKEKGVYSLCR